MRVLSEQEIHGVSGAKPISFFSSYIMGQNGYDPLTSIVVGTVISLMCLTPSLEAFTIANMLTVTVTSLVQSGSGYMLSNLVSCGPKPKTKDTA
ncbi:MAG: hypothetical protein JSR17_10925 [Proteobacteria bacterium]|nr:hypothetical protein [Pseudomonadota bacterium]